MKVETSEGIDLHYGFEKGSTSCHHDVSVLFYCVAFLYLMGAAFFYAYLRLSQASISLAAAHYAPEPRCRVLESEVSPRSSPSVVQGEARHSVPRRQQVNLHADLLAPQRTSLVD